MIYLFVFLMLLLPGRTDAFSEGFKKQMTDIRERTLLHGDRILFTAKEAVFCWQKFDEEILALLNREGEPTEEGLNQEMVRTELTVPDHDEIIEVGEIEVKFYRLESPGGVAWLAVFYNGLGVLPTSTFRIYKEVDGKYLRAASLEEVQGPWDSGKLLWTSVQTEILRRGSKRSRPLFTTYHAPLRAGRQFNRSQILWEFDGETLKAVWWVPEVDWHLVEGKRVAGRGEPVWVTP